MADRFEKTQDIIDLFDSYADRDFLDQESFIQQIGAHAPAEQLQEFYQHVVKGEYEDNLREFSFASLDFSLEDNQDFAMDRVLNDSNYDIRSIALMKINYLTDKGQIFTNEIIKKGVPSPEGISKDPMQELLHEDLGRTLVEKVKKQIRVQSLLNQLKDEKPSTSAPIRPKKKDIGFSK